MQCVQHYQQLTGLPLPQAWELASNQPRRLLGLPVAQIAEGASASLTLFRIGSDGESRELQPLGTVIHGQCFGSVV